MPNYWQTDNKSCKETPPPPRSVGWEQTDLSRKFYAHSSLSASRKFLMYSHSGLFFQLIFSRGSTLLRFYSTKNGIKKTKKHTVGNKRLVRVGRFFSYYLYKSIISLGLPGIICRFLTHLHLRFFFWQDIMDASLDRMIDMPPSPLKSTLRWSSVRIVWCI